ncbi:hypothetical protein BDN71DRAFT_1395623 [Pleurotus eryngii]|uniref:Chromo domain-containing protein n=1 Tax=Pleurotus eryngii TaxID=5323 RepID=A0A9P6DEE2_PLEER|nr:hypothetical protein BDN71DRAFT_1395623 [Pleurotus eryngii]
MLVQVDSAEEYFINCIIDKKKVGRGYQYLIRWVGWGLEEDCWPLRVELQDCEALDQWLKAKGHW